MGAQVQSCTFLLQQTAEIGICLECVAKIRQPHEPDGVLKIFFVANAERDPARVGRPLMFFSKTFLQERISD